ncbi:MAG: ABC transporter permease subunit, partial [Acidimicrobiales bacterium]|nr:ABC transporter permease subunit [Acidimicrobiales bacterium]
VVSVVIGIPLGILSGRFDSVWNVVRPVLDAAQVVHSFVYMLPFIYFWGVGNIGAIMATMVFAVPPLVRLTNLGIREVDPDVVEASRAYGAPELRVLVDVQLPLAKDAILTGVNQTLLLAFSMLGLAAIMGAGGLGQLLFRAIGQQDAALAASAGLAFFIVAVILDRIAQPSSAGGGTSLAARVTSAWRNARRPEVLLDDPAFNPGAAREEEKLKEAADVDRGSMALVGAAERSRILVAAAGGLIAAVSVLLPWANDAGLISGYSRRADEDLAGQSFSGLAASGGSWFGIVVLLLSLTVVASAAAYLIKPDMGGRWLAPDGATFAAVASFITALAYLLARPSDFVVDYSHGVGVYVAVLGTLVAAAGSLAWMAIAPHAPRRPLKVGVMGAPIVMAVFAVVLSIVSMLSYWSIDGRQDAVITPEIQAQIDEIFERARNGEVEAAVATTQVATIRASAEVADRIILDGKESAGAGLGIWVVVFSVLGAAAAFVAAGVAGSSDRRQWLAGAIAMGCGLGVMGIATGWVGSLARASDANFTSGVGLLAAGISGSITFVAGRQVAHWFERSLVYAPSATSQPVASQEPIPEVIPA